MNIAFVILLSAISWGVLSRYVVPTPATWVEEVTSISFAWLIFVGAAEVHRRKQHVSVDLLTSILPLPVQRVLALAVDAFVVLLLLLRRLSRRAADHRDAFLDDQHAAHSAERRAIRA